MFGVIMAGGRGTRFWPSSRKNNPKQLLDIIGPDSMLQMTIDRLKKMNSLEDIFIVTSKELAPKIRKRVKGVNRKNIIVEPKGKNMCFCLHANHCKFMICQQSVECSIIRWAADLKASPLLPVPL